MDDETKKIEIESTIEGTIESTHISEIEETSPIVDEHVLQDDGSVSYTSNQPISKDTAVEESPSSSQYASDGEKDLEPQNTSVEESPSIPQDAPNGEKNSISQDEPNIQESPADAESVDQSPLFDKQNPQDQQQMPNHTNDMQPPRASNENNMQNNNPPMQNNNSPMRNNLNNKQNNNQQTGLNNPQNHQRPNLGVQPKNDNNEFNQGHQRPNLGVQPKSNSNESTQGTSNTSSSKRGEAGSQKLQNAIANKARNLFNLKKKKKKNDNDDGKETAKDDGSDSSGSNQDNSSNDSDEKSDKGLRKTIRKRILILKLSLIGLAFFAFMFIVLLIAIAVSGGTALQYKPLTASTSYGTGKFDSITDENSKFHNIEIAYYQKLQEVYNQYDGAVNINYVSAITYELYYEADFEYDESLEETMGIDFASMTTMVEPIAEIINNTNSTDYSINGPIYNALKNSSTVQNYYENVTKTSTIDDVLKRAFELALRIDASVNYDDTVLTKEVEVNIDNPTPTPPPSTPTTTPTTNPTPKNSSTPTPTPTPSSNTNTTTSIGEYIADSIYGNTSNLNSDTVKAYTIAYSTNLVANNKKLSISSNIVTASNKNCSAKKGCSYDNNGNLVSGAGENNGKNNEQYNGGYFYKRPLSIDEQAALDSDINSVFGNVLVDSNGRYSTVDVNKIEGRIGNYKTILNGAYGSGYTIKNIGENSYALDVNYGGSYIIKNVIFYDQNDYTSTVFCGKKKETIKTSGCGVTSMAIIVSTYEKNRQYDPIKMMNEAYKMGYCGSGISGTSPGFFSKEAAAMKYKYAYASKYSKKELESVLKHLSQGHFVIAHMGPGSFTGGGHYMVLGGIDSATKKVYVYDPNNKSNNSWRGTGNGWYSFNDVIVKQAWGFYIIWKG